MSSYQNPICVALDTPDPARACELARALRGHVGLVKIGLEFFYAHGREGYQAVAAEGIPVFVDLKLHDIPNTVEQGLRSLLSLEPVPAIINMHVAAGPEALARAAQLFAQLPGRRPWLIGVTVLTSLDGEDLQAIGCDPALDSAQQALKRAKLARDNGLDGVVCSPRDIAAIKQACGSEFRTVVPGIRPADAEIMDQKRIATPLSALSAGADVLVIGRPITRAADPAVAAAQILSGLGEAA